MKLGKHAIVLVLAGALVILSAFGKRNKVALQVPKGWPQPVHNFRKEPLSEQKIALGRRLFYDPILSRDSTISCASCHSQYTAFTHVDHALSHGIDGRIGTRNSPALMNLAWSPSFMWDGAVAHLNVQSQKPITNAVEMDETMPHVVAKLQGNEKYRALFDEAYKGGVTGDNLMDALSQFMLTLVSANARYDKVMRGDTVFLPHEARGYALFQKHCASCHVEPLFTSNAFENNGLVPDDSLRDAGLAAITHDPADSFKFKVPTLRNIELSAPYMHDGRFKTLSMVLNNYIRGIHQSPTLNPRLQKGIYLTLEQKADLVAFLLTLTDKDFVTNPAFGFPRK